MHEIFGKSGWASPKALASEAGPSNEKIDNCSTTFPNHDDNNNIGKSKKQKIETIYNGQLYIRYKIGQREKRGEKAN